MMFGLSMMLFVFFLVLDFGLLEWSYARPAENVRRVGILFRGFASTEFTDQFRSSMRRRGWIDGHNVVIEERSAEGRKEQLGQFAKELVDLKIDVIVVNGVTAARAVMAVTNTMPTIAIGGDPTAENLVVNSLRPEANVTVLTLNEEPEVSGKRLELLKQGIPSITRAAVLLKPRIRSHGRHLKHIGETAKILKINVQPVALEGPLLIEKAFSSMTDVEAVLILPWGMDIPQQRGMILHHAAKKRLLTVFTGPNPVRRGGFMSYGPVRTEAWKRAGTIVDKILKGARVADLPVERPIHYELVINVKTANSFGFAVAPELLMQADEVIK
jgi:putative ABC transport system substrate-binding protein